MGAIARTTTQQVATMALADFGPAEQMVVPAGYRRSVDVRFLNIGSADAYGDLYVVDTGNGSNSGYRLRNFPVPYQQAGSAPDFERRFVLTAGQKLQIRGSNTNVVGVSAVFVDDVNA